MIVFISGKDAERYAEAARSHFSYTGMACITYDAMEPANQMHDGAMLALQMYAPLVDLPFKQALEDPKMGGFLQDCIEWLRDNDIGIAKIAMARVNQMTARWEELKMYYVAIIYGESLFRHFPRSIDKPHYSVHLRDKSYPSQGGLNDFAVCNDFDLVVDVNETSPEEAATILAASLRTKLMSALEKTPGKEVLKDPLV